MLQHLVLTRFSCRFAGNLSSENWQIAHNIDLLNPWILDFRFHVFEMTCLPSLSSQTNQDFDWVLIIDRDLPDSFKSRLKQLVNVRERTFVHEYRPGEDITRLEWLQGYLNGNREYVLTTNIDDDDAMPRSYIACLQEHVKTMIAKPSATPLPPFKVLGCKQAAEWDLLFSRKNPLGTAAPWHRFRGTSYPVSCGFSLFCRQPTFDFSVYKLNHSQGEIIFDESIELSDEKWRTVRFEFKSKTSADGNLWNSWKKEFFFDVSVRTGPVVMANHLLNDQTTRLYENKSKRVRVRGPETFPNVTIDWRRTEEGSSLFRKDGAAYLRTMRWCIAAARARGGPLRRKVRSAVKALVLSTLYYMRA